MKGPKALHPAFYGCFDWHSSVHGHWMLVRLLRLFPDLPEAKEIRAVLGEHLTAENLKAEADYFARPDEQVVRAALRLGLAAEARRGAARLGRPRRARQWSQNLQPLADVIVARYLDVLPEADLPDPHRRPSEHGVRAGVRPRLRRGRSATRSCASWSRSGPKAYFGKDADVPAAWEPDGADFFSPSLMEADLMRRVLPPAEFRAWFAQFLPGAGEGRAEGAVRRRRR